MRAYKLFLSAGGGSTSTPRTRSLLTGPLTTEPPPDLETSQLKGELWEAAPTEEGIRAVTRLLLYFFLTAMHTHVAPINIVALILVRVRAAFNRGKRR
jgi:hypothetical protein